MMDKWSWAGDFSQGMEVTPASPTMAPGYESSPIYCQHCGGKLDHPLEINGKYFQHCLNCGRTQRLPRGHPAIPSAPPLLAATAALQLGICENCGRQAAVDNSFRLLCATCSNAKKAMTGSDYFGPEHENELAGGREPFSFAYSQHEEEPWDDPYMDTRRPIIFNPYDNTAYIGNHSMIHSQLRREFQKPGKIFGGHEGFFRDGQVGWYGTPPSEEVHRRIEKELGATPPEEDDFSLAKVAGEPAISVQPVRYDQEPPFLEEEDSQPFVYDRGAKRIYLGDPGYRHNQIHELVGRENFQGPNLHGFLTPEARTISWYDEPEEVERPEIAKAMHWRTGIPYRDERSLREDFSLTASDLPAVVPVKKNGDTSYMHEFGWRRPLKYDKDEDAVYLGEPGMVHGDLPAYGDSAEGYISLGPETQDVGFAGSPIPPKGLGWYSQNMDDATRDPADVKPDFHERVKQALLPHEPAVAHEHDIREEWEDADAYGDSFVLGKTAAWGDPVTDQQYPQTHPEGHRINWKFGEWGKGMIGPDGTVHTWNTGDDYDGWPAHYSYRLAFYPEDSSVPDDRYETNFHIHPDGYMAAYAQYQEHVPFERAAEVSALDPNLHTDPSPSEDFSLASTNSNRDIETFSFSSSKEILQDLTEKDSTDKWNFHKSVDLPQIREEAPEEDFTLSKTAGKLHDFLMNPKSRPDLQTPEAQDFLKHLEKHYHNDKTDPLMPWLTREWKKGRITVPDFMHDPEHGLRDAPPALRYEIAPRAPDGPQTEDRLRPEDLNHWADWYHSNHPSRQGADIMQLKTHDLRNRIGQWDDDMKAKQHEEGLKGGEIAHQYPDGWSLRRLTNGDECKAEGDSMGHCVGGYGDQVENGHTMIYSLRDEKNSPHATMEIEPKHYSIHENHQDRLEENKDPKDWRPSLPPYGRLDGENSRYYDSERPVPHKGELVQVQGKGNQEPKDEYKQRLKEWFHTFPEEDRPTPSDEEAGMYDDEGYWHTNLTDPDHIRQYQERHGTLQKQLPGQENVYGLITQSEGMDADYDQLLDNIEFHDHGPWATHNKDHVDSIYQLARERGEIPQLATAAEGYSDKQQGNFDEWMDQNYQHSPHYPDPDEPHGYEDEEGEEVDEDHPGPKTPYWEVNPIDGERQYSPEEAEKAYDEAHASWEEQHPGMQATQQLYKLLNPHYWSGEEHLEGLTGYQNEVKQPAAFS